VEKDEEEAVESEESFYPEEEPIRERTSSNSSQLFYKSDMEE
jgi:hypothetical protein